MMPVSTIFAFYGRLRKSTTDAQPLSLHESTTPVQRINVISPPPDREAIEYQALPTRNTITEID
jgi:hypothetical protein